MSITGQILQWIISTLWGGLIDLVKNRPSDQDSMPKYGALGAMVSSVTALVVGSSLLPATSHSEVEGSAYLFGIAACLLGPAAGIIGALGSVVVTRLLRTHDAEADLRATALISGAAIGLCLIAAAAIWLWPLGCGQPSTPCF